MSSPLQRPMRCNMPQRVVEADDDGVVPLAPRPQAEVLPHQHRMARRHFARQGRVVWRDLPAGQAVAAGRRQHLDLQAALAPRQADLAEQIVG